MTAHPTFKTAYEKPDMSLRPMRNIEYEALAKVSKKLSHAWQHKQTDFSAFVTALHENLSLWRLLASDVANNDNVLPAALRAKLFYLFEFVKKQTHLAMRNVSGVEVLLDINTAVMRGLRGQDVAA